MAGGKTPQPLDAINTCNREWRVITFSFREPFSITCIDWHQRLRRARD